MTGYLLTIRRSTGSKKPSHSHHVNRHQPNLQTTLLSRINSFSFVECQWTCSEKKPPRKLRRRSRNNCPSGYMTSKQRSNRKVSTNSLLVDQVSTMLSTLNPTLHPCSPISFTHSRNLKKKPCENSLTKTFLQVESVPLPRHTLPPSSLSQNKTERNDQHKIIAG